MFSLRKLSARFAAVALLLMAVSVATAEDADIGPIEVIKKVTPQRNVFQNFSYKNPIVITSAEEASKYFNEANTALLAKRVDFEQQIVLIFAWRGSGGDRLTYSVAESYPEQIFFKYKRGRTKDLRPHLYIYALRKNVTWKLDKQTRFTAIPAMKRTPRP